MVDTAGPIRNPQNACFHWYLQHFEAMFPMMCVRCAQLGVKLAPKGPKLLHFAPDLDFHVHHMASIWGPSGLLWPQLQPNRTNWVLSTPASFLSVLFPGRGQFSSRSDSNIQTLCGAIYTHENLKTGNFPAFFPCPIGCCYEFLPSTLFGRNQKFG